MAAQQTSRLSQWPTYLGLVAVVLFFCLPLFLGLARWDLRGDEAIYSYAVDRMLETGDWLTPRLGPSDRPHLSKPPLKYWMVAGLIGTGLLPHNEVGLRFMDALLGSIAFIYLYWLGRWLGGSLCGVVSVLVLFTLDSFIFVHGLRSNTMEAALVLTYCGGIYHFARWAEGTSTRRQRGHALAVGAYFVLGFMTKFVAALFLPLVCLVALALRPGAREHVRQHWRDGIAAALLVLIATLPWWVYETVTFGGRLWHVMLGRSVYVRLTGTLYPEHLQPWSFYFWQTWNELFYASSAWIVTIGMIMLSIKAWQGRPWLARLLLLWWLLPTVLISIGTSKLYHYAYPFLPPLALGAGYAASALFRVSDGKLGAAITRWRVLSAPGPRGHPSRVLRAARWTLIAGGAVAFALAAWTAIVGQVRWDIGEVTLFRNSSFFRPLSLGVIMWGLGGYTVLSVRLMVVFALALVLPLATYPLRAERLLSVDHPLRSLEECAMRVRRAGAKTGTGVYNAAKGMTRHSYFYYLRHLGPWVVAGYPRQDELRRRLFTSGEQTPVILWKRHYMTLGRVIEVNASPDPSRGRTSASTVQRQMRRPPDLRLLGLAPEGDVVVLMPGPYQTCVIPAARAGGQLVRFIADPETFPVKPSLRPRHQRSARPRSGRAGNHHGAQS